MQSFNRLMLFNHLLFITIGLFARARGEENPSASSSSSAPNDMSKAIFSTWDNNENAIWVNLSPENTKVMTQDIHTSPVYGDALAHKLVPIQVISVLGTPTMTNKKGDAQFLYEIPYAVQNAALMILSMAVKNGTPTAHNFLGDAFTSRFRYSQKAKECTINGSNRRVGAEGCGDGTEKVSFIRSVSSGNDKGNEKGGDKGNEKSSEKDIEKGEDRKNENKEDKPESKNSEKNESDENESESEQKQSNLKEKNKDDKNDESEQDMGSEESKSKNSLFGRTMVNNTLYGGSH